MLITNIFLSRDGTGCTNISGRTIEYDQSKDQQRSVYWSRMPVRDCKAYGWVGEGDISQKVENIY